MKKSKHISLVLISAALASCNRQFNEVEKNDVYMRSDTTEVYTPVYPVDYGGNLWYYAFRPYGYYNNCYYGYYNGYYNNYCGFYFNHPFHFGHHYHYGPHGPGHHRASSPGHYGPHKSTGGFGHRAASSTSHSTAS